MAVHQLQAVQHVVRLEDVEQLDDLGHEQAELGFLACGIAPAARAFAEELHAHADPRPHAVGLRVLEDQAELVEVLHDRDDGPAELGRERHRLDVAVILEAVADDQPVRGVLGHGHDRQQLGLRARLQAESKLLAVAVDLFDHQALLVYLDRKHRGVTVLVIVLRDRLCEGAMNVLQPVRQDVGETNDDGRRQVAGLEPFDDLVQVDLAVGLGVRTYDHVSRRVGAEVTLAPAVDVIQLLGVQDLPRLGGVVLTGATVAGAGSWTVSDLKPRVCFPKFDYDRKKLRRTKPATPKSGGR